MFVFARRVLLEYIVEGKGGGVVDDVFDDPPVAEGAADFFGVDEPLEVVDVVGAIEEGADFFGDGIEGCLCYYGCWSRRWGDW